MADRQLWRHGERVELSARYLDALALFVRNPNQLIEKERFFEEVWDDVVVSDSALTQCIKEIRKQLGDDASNPRFIQTVPRHGYRFVAAVQVVSDTSGETRKSGERAAHVATHSDMPQVTATHSNEATTQERIAIWKTALFECGVGTIGGGIAGLVGGVFYGFSLASTDAGAGSFSTVLVLISLTELAGLIGGFGVSAGIAAGGLLAQYVPSVRTLLRIGGALAGGLVIGSMAKLLGIDAFNLLFGHAPVGITGGPEGALLGGFVALGAYVGSQMGRRFGTAKPWHAAMGAGCMGAVAGALIPFFGGRLMGGSLDLLARSFADSRLQLDTLGPFFGELHFGQATQMALGGFEGMLFGIGLIGALTLLRRSSVGKTDPTFTGI